MAFYKKPSKKSSNTPPGENCSNINGLGRSEGTVLEDLHWRVNDIKQSLAEVLRKELVHRQNTIKEIDARIENLLEGGRRFEKQTFEVKHKKKYKHECCGVFSWARQILKAPESCRRRKIENDYAKNRDSNHGKYVKSAKYQHTMTFNSKSSWESGNGHKTSTRKSRGFSCEKTSVKPVLLKYQKSDVGMGRNRHTKFLSKSFV